MKGLDGVEVSGEREAPRTVAVAHVERGQEARYVRPGGLRHELIRSMGEARGGRGAEIRRVNGGGACGAARIDRKRALTRHVDADA